MQFIREPENKLPVVDEVDLVVVGGSCTGVFAVVRAARFLFITFYLTGVRDTLERCAGLSHCIA